MNTVRRALALLAVSTITCAAVSPARAQARGTLDLVSQPPPAIDLDARRDAAEHKRYSGKALTIMGVVHLALGASLLVADAITSRQCSSTPTCRNEGGSIPFLVPGSLLVSSGAVFASAGVPMWIVGARDVKRAEIGVSASAGGLRLTF